MPAKITRRELGLAAAALTAACASAPESEPEPETPSGPLYFDLHIDTPSRLVSENLSLGEDKSYSCVDIPKMREGGLDAGFFAVFSPARSLTPVESVQRALEITDVIVQEVARYPDDLTLATSVAGIEQARRDGRIAILLGVEGGHMINSSLPVLRQLYRLGARYLGLTHSGNTPWVGAAEYDDGPEGLTDFGREVVTEMNRLGMMIDLAHASDQAFYDTIDASRAPVLNTHACCRAVAEHPRNLTDDMLRALGENGGVLGVAYYAGMLDDEFIAAMPALSEFNTRKDTAREELANDQEALSARLWEIEREAVDSIGRPPLAKLVDHIEHAAEVAGIDHVGLGSDFDSVGLRLPEGLDHIGQTPNLVAALEERGFSDEDVNKVMGGNALRVFREAEAAAE